jgi:hypothetical protein
LVTLFPNCKCSCVIKENCSHIFAAKMSIGLECSNESKKPITLSKLRNTKRNNKKAGRKYRDNEEIVSGIERLHLNIVSSAVQSQTPSNQSPSNQSPSNRSPSSQSPSNQSPSSDSLSSDSPIIEFPPNQLFSSISSSCIYCKNAIFFEGIKCQSCEKRTHLNCLKPSLKKLIKSTQIWFCSDKCL